MPETPTPIPTTGQEIFDSFESSFQDKMVIPIALEFEWLIKAIARYSIEIDPLTYTENRALSELTFSNKLDRYVVDTLAAFMKQSYQERETSKINKRVSIVGKDLSIDGNNGTKNAARYELEYDAAKSSQMIENQKPSAYV